MISIPIHTSQEQETVHRHLLCVQHVSNLPLTHSPATHRTVGHSHAPEGPASMRKTKQGSRKRANYTHERHGPGVQTLDGRIFCKDLLQSYCAVSVENKNMAKSNFYPRDTHFRKRGQGFKHTFFGKLQEGRDLVVSRWYKPSTQQ